MSDMGTDLSIIEALDFEPEILCGSSQHSTGRNGCLVDEFASWYYRCPGCKVDVPCCSGAKEWLVKNFHPLFVFGCRFCGCTFCASAIIWTPIRAVS